MAIETSKHRKNISKQFKILILKLIQTEKQKHFQTTVINPTTSDSFFSHMNSSSLSGSSPETRQPLTPHTTTDPASICTSNEPHPQ